MEEKEKIPHMFESIGHRSLRSRCPKTNADSKILPTKFMISKFFFEFATDLKSGNICHDLTSTRKMGDIAQAASCHVLITIEMSFLTKFERKKSNRGENYVIRYLSKIHSLIFLNT